MNPLNSTKNEIKIEKSRLSFKELFSAKNRIKLDRGKTHMSAVEK